MVVYIVGVFVRQEGGREGRRRGDRARIGGVACFDPRGVESLSFVESSLFDRLRTKTPLTGRIVPEGAL